VRQILRAFPADATARFFRELGVPLHEEADGKLFPDSNRARDVLDALLKAAANAGVALLVDHRVLDVSRGPDGFRITTAQGDLRARTVVLAAGGRSVPKTGSDGSGYEIAARLGHSIVPTTPGLAPLVLAAEDLLHQRLSGVSHDAELTVWVDGAVAARLRGALLWTHFGLSGPAALNASRHWARAHLEGRAVTMTASFCPDEDFEQIDARMRALAHDRPKASLHASLATFLPASMAEALLAALAMDREVTLAHLSRDQRRRLAHALTAWPLAIADTRGFNYAEVTAGGVSLAEIDPATMESRVCRGLYLVGEILDVDGRIGGFNFQWAWASAYVAGRSLGTLDE
jgi:predicted Rossmann fold flavoprotein